MTINAIEIRNCSLRFYTYEGVVKALESINLDIRRGETFGLVGETGSGKSVTGLALLGIVLPPGRVEEGSIIIQHDKGRLDILKQSQENLRKIRGEDGRVYWARTDLKTVATIGAPTNGQVTFTRRGPVSLASGTGNLAADTIDYILFGY